MDLPSNDGLSRRDFARWLSLGAALGVVDPRLAVRILDPADRLCWRAHREPGRLGEWRLEEIDGKLPRDLIGTLLRVAPGQTENHGVRLRHHFDGDALLARWRFDDEGIELTTQYVDTPERRVEQRARRMLYTEFGTLPRLDDGEQPLGSKNQPSVNVIRYDGRLLGLSEGDHPTELDPDTLTWRSVWDFHGTLPDNVTFTAHPKFDPTTGEGIGYGIVKGPGLALVLYRMKSDGKLEQIHAMPQPGYFMIHDVAITPNYAVFVVPPVTLDVLKLMSGRFAPADVLEYAETEPTRIIVMPRDGAADPFTIEQPASMCFHHGNAFENEGELVVDSLLSADGSVLEALAAWSKDELPGNDGARAEITRLVIDLEEETLKSREPLVAAQEFPRFDERRTGQRSRYLYTVEHGDPEHRFVATAIHQRDDRSGDSNRARADAHQTLGEPVFVPRSADAAEDDGYLLHLGYDGERDQTFLDVRDARTLERAARAWSGTHLPLGFHGNWLG